jgi:hypothetical protein
MIQWTCSGTRLVPSQVLHFRAKAQKCYNKEVVQKLKFLNNNNIECFYKT